MAETVMWRDRDGGDRERQRWQRQRWKQTVVAETEMGRNETESGRDRSGRDRDWERQMAETETGRDSSGGDRWERQMEETEMGHGRQRQRQKEIYRETETGEINMGKREMERPKSGRDGGVRSDAEVRQMESK